MLNFAFILVCGIIGYVIAAIIAVLVIIIYQALRSEK